MVIMLILIITVFIINMVVKVVIVGNYFINSYGYFEFIVILITMAQPYFFSSILFPPVHLFLHPSLLNLGFTTALTSPFVGS